MLDTDLGRLNQYKTCFYEVGLELSKSIPLISQCYKLIILSKTVCDLLILSKMVSNLLILSKSICNLHIM